MSLPTEIIWGPPLLALVIGYLLGSIPFGVLLTRASGAGDLRQIGSGNIGATNVLRTGRKDLALATLLLDSLKAGLAALAFTLVAGREAGFIAGAAAFVGHCYPVWLNFKGGKGIATSAGVLIALMPFAVILLIAVFLAVFLITRYVSVASVVSSAALPMLTLWGSWHHGRLQDGTWNKPLFVFSVIIAVLAIWKHRSNLKRLLEGTEHRFERKNQSADA
jgi:glycerol-3-phosphate acyltransferase PlsY